MTAGMQLNTRDRDNLDAVRSDGLATPANRDGAPSTWGLNLVGGNTYYVVLSGQISDGALAAAAAEWSGAFAGTITIEDTIFPRRARGGDGSPVGIDDVSDFAAAPYWQQENPSTAYVPVSGTGNSVANLTITAGGTNAGGFIAHLGNLGSPRVRLKIVCTTSGRIRVGCMVKD